MSLKEIKSTPLSEVFGIGDSSIQTLCELCKKKAKWGMYIALQHSKDTQGMFLAEYVKAAPYLKYDANDNILINGFGYFFFDTEEAMQQAFDVTVGEGGPTEFNDYAGPATVYAVTCGPQGIEIDENT